MSDENSKKSIGILFFSGPYQTQAPETVCKIAEAALDKGIGVQVFLYMDAANCVLENQKSVHGITNIEEKFRNIVEKGAMVRVCNLCLDVRGTARHIMKLRNRETGGLIKRAGTPDLAKIVTTTDKLLVIH